MGSEQKNALLAAVLSGLILFGWQYYFSPPKQNTAPIEPAVTTSKPATSTDNSQIGAKTATSGPIEPAPAANEVFTIATNDVSISFDSTLMVKDMKNSQAGLKFEDIVSSNQPMRVEFDFGNGFEALMFAKSADNKFHNSTNDLTLTTAIDEKGRVGFTLNSSRLFKYRFIYKSETRKLENGQVRVFAVHTDELNTFDVGDEDDGDRAIKWAGVDFNYHLFALYFDKPQTLIYKNRADNIFTMYSAKAEKTLSYHLVFVKKEYNYLSGLENNLKSSVNFGIWGFFAVWILKGLQFFYTFIPNYGVSIILLTLLIRLITFPLQYKSVVSMKKLQLVQPELTKIREKFKDDPARLQKESMELFRKSGANPIGGCLPLLLQMPVFFAFYKVLYSAVELVDAPFMLWIHDLSNKDPYYVLPVLMTGAMFLQQKLTPNTISDPVQKKVMMFMPLIFGFIMKDLPSGLSLYIFVSTLFGILQQMLVFNSKTSDKPVVV
ncbi:MAG TPA: membrane protein insertase YidC [Bacteriovoracaceae bacterium]|nr:membrane protein insertase YidC [Bacteriovoracaceae bacterium]